MIIIVHGPQGCGKTQNASRLAAAFGCTSVFEWESAGDDLQDGALLLTNDHLDGVRSVCRSFRDVEIRVMPYALAMQKVESP